MPRSARRPELARVSIGREVDAVEVVADDIGERNLPAPRDVQQVDESSVLGFLEVLPEDVHAIGQEALARERVVHSKLLDEVVERGAETLHRHAAGAKASDRVSLDDICEGECRAAA